MRDTQTYDLVSLALQNTYASLAKHFIKEERGVFPQTIESYTFKEVFKKIGPRKSYPLAIYENKQGKKAIAKMMRATIKGYHYYSLKNEIVLFTILNAYLKKNKKNIPGEFQDIYVPKLLATYEDEKVLVSLVEFVEGSVAEKLPAKEKINIYFKMVDFLHYIGDNLSLSDRSKISKRKSKEYLLLYPALVVKAMITYPYSWKLVLKGVNTYVRLLPILIENKQLALVHRDLHFMNILHLNNNKFALVDFQQCVYTEPLHELITTLRYWWKFEKGNIFGKMLLQQIIARNKNRNNFLQLFQIYSIQSVTHGLTGDGFNKKIINGWLDFLRFGITPNFEKYQ